MVGPRRAPPVAPAQRVDGLTWFSWTHPSSTHPRDDLIYSSRQATLARHFGNVPRVGSTRRVFCTPPAIIAIGAELARIFVISWPLGEGRPVLLASTPPPPGSDHHSPEGKPQSRGHHRSPEGKHNKSPFVSLFILIFSVALQGISKLLSCACACIAKRV